MQALIEKLKTGEGAVNAVLWIGLGIVILLIVIFLAAWLIRTLRPTLNMSGGSSRGGRPQRLAITDAFNLDREGRKLVIIRRDNTEHLLLIGGPTDVVVETNIIRGERLVRDGRPGRGDSAETNLPSELAALAETRHPPTPLSPAPVLPPSVAISAQPILQSAGIPSPPMRPAAPPPPLHPAPVLPPPQLPSAPPPPSSVPPPAAPPAASIPAPTVTTPNSTGGAARYDDAFEQALSAMQSAQRQQTTPPPRPRPAAQSAPIGSSPPPLVQPPSPASPVAPLPSLTRSDSASEMARRLSEVLQKPLNSPLRPATDTLPPPARPVPPPPAAPVTALGPGSEMDLLEEEMARLLGRPQPPRKPDAS